MSVAIYAETRDDFSIIDRTLRSDSSLAALCDLHIVCAKEWHREDSGRPPPYPINILRNVALRAVAQRSKYVVHGGGQRGAVSNSRPRKGSKL